MLHPTGLQPTVLFKLAADILTMNDASVVNILAVTIGAINAGSSFMWYNTHGNRNMSKYIPPLDKLVENNPTAYQVLGRASGLITSANYALFTGSSISKTSVPLGIFLVLLFLWYQTDLHTGARLIKKMIV